MEKLTIMSAIGELMSSESKKIKINRKNNKKFFLITTGFIVFVTFILLGMNSWGNLNFYGEDKALNLVKNRTDGAIIIDREFSAIANLTGFLVHFKNDPTNEAIIYADKQGRYLLMGNVVDKDGLNITSQHTAQFIHDPMMINAFNHLHETHWILQGNPHAQHMITIMIDPDSSVFPLQYEHVLSDVADNDLAVRWILVSYLKPYGGVNRAAAILQAKDPIVALALNAKNYNFKAETGGIKPASFIAKKTATLLQDNWNFMQKYKFYATPIVFYQTSDNKSHIVTGFMMDEMLEKLMPSLTGAK